MRVLVDTCAALWFSGTGQLSDAADTAFAEARKCETAFVYAITAWEIAKKVSIRKLELDRSPAVWFEDFMTLPGCYVAPLTPRILIESSFLPGDFHKDPADRMIVATARMLDLTIITRDRKILAYVDQGFVKALAC